MGDATLSATRELARGGTQLRSDPQRAILYNSMGLTMLVYPTWVGRLLGGGALLLFTILLLRVRARHLLTLRDVLAAGASNCLAVAVGVLAALLPALVVKVFLHRAIGWLAAPALLLACSAIPSAAGTLFIHGWWRAHALRKMAGDIERVALTAWMGSLGVWAFWLLLATVRGVGAGYLPLYWVAGSSFAAARRKALFSCAYFSLRRCSGWSLGAVPTIEIATMFVVNIVPMSDWQPQGPGGHGHRRSGRTVNDFRRVVAFTVPCRTGGTAKAACACAALGIVGIALTAAHAPYSSIHPKRLVALHAADAGQSALLLASPGSEGMVPLLSLFPDAKPLTTAWPTVRETPITHLLPAPTPAMPAPQVEVTSEHHDPVSDTRQITLHLFGTGGGQAPAFNSSQGPRRLVCERLPCSAPVHAKPIPRWVRRGTAAGRGHSAHLARLAPNRDRRAWHRRCAGIGG